MKLIIDISEGIKTVIDNNGTNEFVAETLWQAVKNGTPIPDNATNGEVIDLIFPYEKTIDEAWWNSPYQKGGKE